MVGRTAGSTDPEGAPEAGHVRKTGDGEPHRVALRRLLAVTTLTPAQAQLLVADLADGLAAHDRAGRSPGPIDDRTVTVAEDGTVHVPASDGAANGDPVGSAAVLIRRIVAGTRHHPRATWLSEAVAGSASSVDELPQRIRSAAPDDADAGNGRVRKQLAALVVATQGRRDVGGVPSEEDSGRRKTSAPTALRPLSPKRPRRIVPRRRGKTWKSQQRRRARKFLFIGLIVLMLGGLAWWGAPKAWTELQRGWQAVFDAPEPSREFAPVTPAMDNSGTSPSGAGGEKKRDSGKQAVRVKRPAPEQAGAVTGVTVQRAEGPCAGRKSCTVRVDVRLEPSSEPQPVAWKLRVVNRCSGKKLWRGGLEMVAEPGWRQVYGISRPSVPRTKALAIVAVTTSPARAASEPLYVPARDAKC